MAGYVAEYISVEHTGDIGGTHLGGALAQMLQAVEGESARLHFQSGLFKAT